MAPGTIITTGTGAGLGTEIAIQLLSACPAGTHNIFTVRPSQNKSSPTYVALNEAIEAAKEKPEILHLSLDDLAKVKAFAADINARVASGAIPRIQALILNAGVQFMDGLHMTSDGYEAVIQVNYLSNFLLIRLLLPSFAGVDSKDVSAACRIIFISSDSHDPARRKGFPDTIWPANLEYTWHPDSGEAEKNPRTFGMGTYAFSKLCLVMHMFALQRRLDRSSKYSSITTVSIDPGWMLTDLMRSKDFATQYLVRPMLKIGPSIAKLLGAKESQLRTPAASAVHVVEATFADYSQHRPKAGFIINGKSSQAGEMARDEEKQEQLYKKTAELLSIDDVLTEW